MCLLLGMFLGSINYNNNLGFLLTFLLGTMAFVSIIYTYKNMRGIQVAAAAAKAVFAGEQAVFRLIADGAAANRYEIGFALPGAKPARHDIPAGTQKRVDIGVRTFSRGVLDPGPLILYSDYPLGLFRIKSEKHLSLECIVYPAPLDGKVKTITERYSADGDEQGGGSGADDFQGLKGYVPGDPLQRISWRASSRGQGLFTKDFNGQHASPVYPDWYSLVGPDAEHKLSLLCRWILTAHQSNLTFGLKLPGCTLAPGNGRMHKERCLKTLALFSG
jgi:uncharacterized protein (DUF58 family)